MKKLTLTILNCLLIIYCQAQVTIGASIEPVPGALLDLKEYTNPSTLDNSTRGLLLPRVKLTDLSSLLDIGAIGLENEHVGLTIYNIGYKDICDNMYKGGVYVWNGTQWALLGKEKNPTISTSKTGIDQPNSYMISGKGTITIPVAKAFSVWDGSSWTDDNGNPTLISNPFTGNTMTVSVLWMDNEGVITDVSVSSSTADPSATITVKTGTCGNAIIALDMSGKIAWSWHIWVTPPVEEISFNGHTWMDRNLGAISDTPDNPLTKGLYYQWGRKDPFPYKRTDWSTTGEPTLYTPTGANPTVNKSYTVGSNNMSNLTTSIQNPLSFIKSNAFPYDWYSQSQSMWNGRWGSNGGKSVSDPCPEGWRVPDGNPSPWGTSLTVGTLSDFNNDKGWNWSTAGFYSAPGCRVDVDGEIKGVSVNGYYWTGQTNLSLAKGMYFNSAAMDTAANGYRASGFSVRCVKE